MNIEEKIANKLEKDLNAKRQRRINCLINALKTTFDVDITEEDLQPTKYNNVWSTGKIYWVVRDGYVMWSRTLNGENYQISDISPMYRHITRKKWWQR